MFKKTYVWCRQCVYLLAIQFGPPLTVLMIIFLQGMVLSFSTFWTYLLPFMHAIECPIGFESSHKGTFLAGRSILKLLCTRKLVTMQLTLRHRIWRLFLNVGFTNNKIRYWLWKRYVWLYCLGCITCGLAMLVKLCCSSAGLSINSNKFRVSYQMFFMYGT